jgi:hypothetical protein
VPLPGIDFVVADPPVARRDPVVGACHATPRPMRPCPVGEHGIGVVDRQGHAYLLQYLRKTAGIVIDVPGEDTQPSQTPRCAKPATIAVEQGVLRLEFSDPPRRTNQPTPECGPAPREPHPRQRAAVLARSACHPHPRERRG